MTRVNGTVPWADLEPYMDWFADAGAKELHTRKAGRTWEEWRDAQPMKTDFDPNKLCRFREEMEEYLRKDVLCLHQLVSKVGEQMWARYKADIRVKCTAGSIAEHIWMHTLLKPLPKLKLEIEHLLWQRVNRGGFCGPLAVFDSTAPEGS